MATRWNKHIADMRAWHQAIMADRTMDRPSLQRCMQCSMGPFLPGGVPAGLIKIERCCIAEGEVPACCAGYHRL